MTGKRGDQTREVDFPLDRMHVRAATFIAMQRVWPLVVLAGGALVVIAFVLWFDDADCGSDRDCGYLVELAVRFWILLVLGIATVVAGFILRSRREGK